MSPADIGAGPVPSMRAPERRSASSRRRAIAPRTRALLTELMDLGPGAIIATDPEAASARENDDATRPAPIDRAIEVEDALGA